MCIRDSSYTMYSITPVTSLLFLSLRLYQWRYLFTNLKTHVYPSCVLVCVVDENTTPHAPLNDRQHYDSRTDGPPPRSSCEVEMSNPKVETDQSKYTQVCSYECKHVVNIQAGWRHTRPQVGKRFITMLWSPVTSASLDVYIRMSIPVYIYFARKQRKGDNETGYKNWRRGCCCEHWAVSRR